MAFLRFNDVDHPCSVWERRYRFVPRRRQSLQAMCLNFWKAYRRWDDSGCVDLSAAFAYYALQSIFPLLLIALAVAARIYGNGSGVEEVLRAIGPLLPPSVIDLVQSTLLGLVAQGFGAGLLGLVVLLVTASNVYLTLQRGADRLWQQVLPSTADEERVKWQIIDFLRNRIQAFFVVLSVAVLIVVEQIVAGLTRLPSEWLAMIEPFVPLLRRFLQNQHVFALVQ